MLEPEGNRRFLGRTQHRSDREETSKSLHMNGLETLVRMVITRQRDIHAQVTTSQ